VGFFHPNTTKGDDKSFMTETFKKNFSFHFRMKKNVIFVFYLIYEIPMKQNCFKVDQYMRDSRVKRKKSLIEVLNEAKKYGEKKTEEKIQFWKSKEKPSRWPKIFVVMRIYWKVK